MRWNAKRRSCFFALALLLGSMTVFGAENHIDNKTISSGDEFTLKDGRTLKLEGIHGPLAETPALRDQAHAEIEKLISGHELTLDDMTTDRYGRVSAQASINKISLQKTLLQDGFAFVYPAIGSDDLEEILKTENEARANKRGIWADDFYVDIPAEKADTKFGQFAFVTGKILKAERIKNKVCLNFGADWRTDFAVSIAAHDLHFFKKDGIDPLNYEGKTVRIRGWVKHDFGPMISVTEPGQIEIIAAK